jgi:hypothetical protein
MHIEAVQAFKTHLEMFNFVDDDVRVVFDEPFQKIRHVDVNGFLQDREPLYLRYN